MKLTRREVAAALASGTALAQQASRPPAAPSPAAPGDELQTARERVKANGERLAAISVPMATEPAFQFKA